MRTLGRTLSFSLSLALGLGVVASVGCGDDGDSTGAGFADAVIINDFADQVVIPTYLQLSGNANDLKVAVAALEADTSAANLTAAQAAWRAARQPWEQSEGFLFGPVDSNGYDPAMDSWPVDKTSLDGVLASDDEFTPAYVMGLAETQKGFHTIEYLLFGTNSAQTAEAITERQLAYLTAITDEFDGVAQALADSWLEGDMPYRQVFITAGEPTNTAYPSLASAGQEIVNGMVGICDEVANGKIAEPYDEKMANLEESQFSNNSIQDFQDNLRSVQNAYLGAFPLGGTSGRGLTVYVASLDAALDERVKTEIQDAIDAIGEIPAPFSEAILDPEAAEEIEAAQQAIRRVQATLESDVTPLILQ
jgi:putative iron-regulated protein